MSHPINKTYICNDCVFVYTIHTEMPYRKMPFCPKCGDKIAVIKYKPAKKQSKQFWSAEEMELIDKIVAGELRIYQVAAKLKRTGKSVKRRVERRREELNK